MTLRITVLPNKTFRGVMHFVETDYDVSDELARHAIQEGIAKWKDVAPPYMSGHQIQTRFNPD